MTTKVIKFSDQAAAFLNESATRNQDPLRPATLKRYREAINLHLNPEIGKLGLQDIGNKVVKQLAAKLMKNGLKPATIQLNINLIKQIRASAVNDEGEQLYPYQWNARFIDAPTVDPDLQKRPVLTAAEIENAISKCPSYHGALYALLAGTGLRIAEALALKLDPDDGVSTVYIPSESKIIVRQQRIGNEFGPTKTKAGVREVDLAPELNDYFGNFLKSRYLEQPNNPEHALIFEHLPNYYQVCLKKNGIDSGFHAFRRFRLSHLDLGNVPEMMKKFWAGHAAKDVTERYIKVGKNIEARKTTATSVGLGFKLPEKSE